MSFHGSCRRAALALTCLLALACGSKDGSGKLSDAAAGGRSLEGGSDSVGASGGGAGPGTGGSAGWTNPDSCPEDAPEGSADCDQSAASCHYDGQQCACISGEWACNECPDKAPKRASSCEQENTVCQYTDRTCICGGGLWLCLSDDCPDSKPAAWDECSTEGMACPYKSASCACLVSDFSTVPVWICMKNAGCPDERPGDGKTCSGLMLCEYGKVLCACTAGLSGEEQRWSCM